MTSEEKIINMIGLATRAGKIAAGAPAVEKALAKKNARLIIIAGDASDRAKEELISSAGNVPVLVILTKERLGHATGREYLAAVCVTDDGFTKAIQKISEH